MFRSTLTALVVSAALPAAVFAQADLTDPQMAHVAVTASNIDIEYAHLALAFSQNESVREFAQTMIRDHSAVNEQVFELAQRLGVTAQDNPLSRQLIEQSKQVKDRLSRLRGGEFDRAYVENEAQYHQTVNGVVADGFIPNADNGEVKQAFQAALQIFRAHQEHAESLVQSVARR
jgi:putative membrane protein